MSTLAQTLLLTLCIQSLPLLAHAQDLPSQDEEAPFDALDELTRQRITELLDLIEQAEASAHHDKALSYLDEAQQLFDHPEFWLDRARILESLGRHQEAAGWIKRFTQVRPDSPRTTTLTRRAQALANTPDRSTDTTPSGILRVTSEPPGARVTLKTYDAPLKGSTPSVAIPIVRVQTLTLIISKYGYLPKERTIVVEPGQTRTLHVSLDMDKNSPLWHAPDTRATSRAQRGAAPWVLWGIGGAGVIGMVVSAQHVARLDDRAARGEEPSSNAYRRTQTAFGISTGVAIAGLLGGTIVWIVRSPHPGDAALTITPGPASVHITF